MRGFPQARKAELASALVVLGRLFWAGIRKFFCYFFCIFAYMKVDCHCHILPGLDVGAQSLEESVFLAGKRFAF